MVPHAPPVVAPPPVFRPDWETLARHALTLSKLLDLNVRPAPTSLRRFYGATDKPKHAWVCGPNQETVAAGFEAIPSETVTTVFEAKPVKTIRVVLRLNHSQTVAIGFEAQTDENQSEWF
jgi:hypothetical protein